MVKLLYVLLEFSQTPWSCSALSFWMHYSALLCAAGMVSQQLRKLRNSTLAVQIRPTSAFHTMELLAIGALAALPHFSDRLTMRVISMRIPADGGVGRRSICSQGSVMTHLKAPPWLAGRQWWLDVCIAGYCRPSR